MPPEPVYDKCLPGGLLYAGGRHVDARLVPVDRLDEVPPLEVVVQYLADGVDPEDPANADAVAEAQAEAQAVAFAVAAPADVAVDNDARAQARAAATERLAVRLVAAQAAAAELRAAVAEEATTRTVTE